MTRLELLHLVVGHARTNGFAFRRWYVSCLGRVWSTSTEAFETLSSERRYYALLFHPEFARHFWKAGTTMTVQVEAKQFQRSLSDGSTRTVLRKGYTRRLTRDDAWRYHLREMVLLDEPLRYVRRFLPVAEALEAGQEQTSTPEGHDPRFIVDSEDLLGDDD